MGEPLPVVRGIDDPTGVFPAQDGFGGLKRVHDDGFMLHPYEKMIKKMLCYAWVMRILWRQLK
jgi:hypothetical protein